jgi:hypothetical protein
MLAKILAFFSAAEGSAKGTLNAEELYRAIFTALGSGTSVGALLMGLQAVVSNASLIFPNPTVAALATALLTLVIDCLRRQSQGTPPSPTPSPVPVLVPVSN